MATADRPAPFQATQHVHLAENSAELARFLYRPIVFHEPQRVVPPVSWVEHIPFAFWVVEALRPRVLLELGTHSGNSYAAFAQAIQALELSTAAYAVDTWRGDPQAGFYDENVFAEWSHYHDRHFSAFSRLIRSTFEEALQHFSDRTIDLLHIDGYHTYESAAADFERWRPKLSDRAVVLLHDINVRERDFGAWRLWEGLRTQSPSFEFLHGHGLGVLGVGSEQPDALRWLFSCGDADAPTAAEIRQFFARIGGGVLARFIAAESAANAADAAAESAAHAAAEIASARQELADARTEAARELAERDVTTVALQVEVTALRGRLAILDGELAPLQSAIADLEAKLSRARGHEERLATELELRVGNESLLHRQLETERARSRHQTGSAAANWRTSLCPIAMRAAIRRSAWWRRLSHAKAVGRSLVTTVAPLPSVGVRRGARSLLAVLARPRRLRDVYAVAASRLFDPAYYARRYPDVVRGPLTPLVHFVVNGASEGRNPHPLFDVEYYRACNSDVAAAGINPLAHYWRRGALEGRSPHPLFDSRYYLDQNPDVRNARLDPLWHFLTTGAREGRNPNPFFDCAYYVERYPDVAATGTNPLVHFELDGWREGRQPSAVFDTQSYLRQYPDVRALNRNPLAHYLGYGQAESRHTAPRGPNQPAPAPTAIEAPTDVRIRARRLSQVRPEPPTVLCLSHVAPWPPRAGNEYRIYRMLCWLRDQGYRIVPVIAPLPGDTIDPNAIHAIASQFSNAVVCNRDGGLQYVLRDVPDVLGSLNGRLAGPVGALLDEDRSLSQRQARLLATDRTFCHDGLVTVATRLGDVLGPHIIIAEYIWMSRVLPLILPDVLKVIDTHDIFSTKRDKVLRFGIDDFFLEPEEEAERLRRADLVLAIQDDERVKLEQLVPGTPVVTAGVDFDVVEDVGMPVGRRILYVASDNPMNRKGLSDFLRFAWPHVRREVPDAELVLAGRISACAPDSPGVVRMGALDDLKPMYGEARVVINPAIAGSGLKIKTLEALVHQRRIVTWPTGTDGLRRELAGLCTTVHDWYEFSRTVGLMLASEEPLLFSRAEHDAIVRLTSARVAYGAMTEAMNALQQERQALRMPSIG